MIFDSLLYDEKQSLLGTIQRECDWCLHNDICIFNDKVYVKNKIRGYITSIIDGYGVKIVLNLI